MRKIDELGKWGYIRYLYKNELDNAKNFRIQGLAAHITNRAMLEVTRKMQQEKINGYVVLQVHDEITLMVAKKDSRKGGGIIAGIYGE